MINLKKLDDKAILPRYATDGASAFDVFAMEKLEWKLNFGGFWELVVPTGWAFGIPKEHGLFIYSRSGHGFKFNTHLANCVGLLDWDYRGQLMVKLVCFDFSPPVVDIGTAIAQCVVLETPRQFFNVVKELDETKRGANGFGSTDEKN